MADTPENDKNEQAGPAKKELSEPETIGVTVPVPNNINVKVKDLHGMYPTTQHRLIRANRWIMRQYEQDVGVDGI